MLRYTYIACLVKPNFVLVIPVAVTYYRECIFDFKLNALWTWQLVFGPQIVCVCVCDK